MFKGQLYIREHEEMFILGYIASEKVVAASIKIYEN